MFGETTIFHVKIWNHPIETTILKWMFQVPGSNLTSAEPQLDMTVTGAFFPRALFFRDVSWVDVTSPRHGFRHRTPTYPQHPNLLPPPSLPESKKLSEKVDLKFAN